MKSLWRVAKLFMVSFCLIAEASASEKISPYFGIGSDAFLFSIESFNDVQENLNYEPNTPGLTRIGLSAYGLGASLSTRGPTTELDKTRGESKFFDFQVGYHNAKWGADLYVQNYKGFFLKNSSQVGGTTSYHLFPDLKFTHYGLMGRYSLDNPDGFSISGLLNQADDVTKTAGSYFLIGGVRHYSLETGEISMVPSPLIGMNPELDALRKMSVTTLNIGVGAGKYWVSSGGFFIGGVLDITGTYGLYKYILTSDDNTADYSTVSPSLKAGAGFSGKNWRSGVSAYVDTTTLQGPDHTFIKPQATAFFIYVRYVFDDESKTNKPTPR